MEIDKLIARREAHADAALAAIKAADERVTMATRSSHKRPRSPKPVGLLKASDPEEKTKKYAIWPSGAKRR